MKNMQSKTKILIAVPSKGRHESILKFTYSFLQYSKHDFKIFVEPQDFESYSSNGEIFTNHLVSIDKNDQGLKYAKIKIRDYAKENGYTHIFKLDDDLTGLRDTSQRKLPKEQKVKNDKRWRVENIFDKLIEDSVELFTHFGNEIKGVATIPGYAMYSFDGRKWTNYNASFKSNYITDVDYFVSDEYCLLHNLEDQESYFNILQKGFQTIEYGLTGIDNDIFKLEGGHQSKSLNRQENEEKHKNFMESVFPGLIFREVPKQLFKYKIDFRKTTINGVKIQRKAVSENFSLNLIK